MWLTTKHEKSTKIVEELKRRQQEKKIVDVNQEKINLVIFKLLGENYAFYGFDVREVLQSVRINPVPGAPDFVVGIIYVRGDIEVVIDVNLTLGLPKLSRIEKNYIIIAEKESICFGVLVEAVEDFVDVFKSSVNDSPETLNEAIKDYVAGETEYKNQTITLLDVGKIFNNLLAN